MPPASWDGDAPIRRQPDRLASVEVAELLLRCPAEGCRILDQQRMLAEE